MVAVVTHHIHKDANRGSNPDRPQSGLLPRPDAPGTCTIGVVTSPQAVAPAGIPATITPLSRALLEHRPAVVTTRPESRGR